QHAGKARDRLLGEDRAVAVEFLLCAVLEDLTNRVAIGFLVVADGEHEDAGEEPGDQRCPADDATRRIPFERPNHLAVRRGRRTGTKAKKGKEGGRGRGRKGQGRGGWGPGAGPNCPGTGEGRKQARHSPPAETSKAKRERREIEQES